MPDTWQLGVGEGRARVAIVGCGGAGCNTLRQVVDLPNSIRIAVDDDLHPPMAEISHRILIPGTALQAYATMDDKAVPQMETREEKEISAVLLDQDIVLILGGLGGELGGWGMSLVGRVARILGDASVAFATAPFTIEGPIRRQLAEAQLQLLRKRVDGVVTFHNDGLIQIARELPIAKALTALDAIIARAASGLSFALAGPDIAPLRRMLSQVHEWRFGMGVGRDLHRCFVAVDEAYKSPWFAMLPEEVTHAVVLMAVPEPGKDDAEILRQIRLRSPDAAVAWARRPEAQGEDRATVQIFAGT